MLIKWGSLVVDGRGKIGGHVASKNRGGAYMRTKVTPTNPQTQAQALVRNRLANFSSAWRTLTQSVRNAWNVAVSDFQKTNVFGDIKSPSGLNLYVKLNANLEQVGVAALTSPPLPADIGDITNVTADPDSTLNTFDVSFLPDPVPANTAFVLEVTRQLSPGINFVKNEYRFLMFFDAATASPVDIHLQYTAKFGALVEGQKIGVKLTPVNKTTGQKGIGLSKNVIVIA